MASPLVRAREIGLMQQKKKMKMIYPAVEPLGKELSYLDPRVDEKKFIKQFILDNWNKIIFSSPKYSRAEDLQAQEVLNFKGKTLFLIWGFSYKSLATKLNIKSTEFI